MDFTTFLTRADDQTLQSLLGAKTIRLANALGGESASISRIRDLLLNLKAPQQLLADKQSRVTLLELLRPTEARVLSEILGLPKGDPYAALRAMALSQERLGRLLSFFGLQLAIIAEEDAPPTSLFVAPRHPLFPHQIRAAREVRIALRTGRRRVLLHMPTGSGKTRTAMHVIADHLRDADKAVVVWLAHSEELCDQAAAEFAAVWSNVGNRELRVLRFWGEHELAAPDVHDGLMVAGFPKMYNRGRSDPTFLGRLAAQASLVIVDEAHQAIAPTYRQILDTLVEPHPQTGFLGLSATPGRTWNDIARDEELAEFFARTKVTLRIDGYDNPVMYLVDQGYLAHLSFRQLSFGGPTGLRPEDEEAIRAGFDIPPSVLRRLAEDDKRTLAILVAIEGLLTRHKRVIVFATTVEHAELLASALCVRGHVAAAVTGATPSNERRRILDAFRSAEGPPRVLCNFGVLTTGFDAPRTSAAVIARPTGSLVLYSQMVGRAARGPRAGGNAEAEIVTVVDTGLPGFGDMAAAFINWEDVWT